MLTITVDSKDFFDDDSQEFVSQGGFTVGLEHSLVSLSKWESIYERPFLSAGEKTTEEIVKYIECMSLDPNIAPEVFARLDEKALSQIQVYIDAKMTATWFAEQKASRLNGEIITAELVYYWMISFEIPFACETWHLNRLFTLIRICNVKAQPAKKLSREEIGRRQRELNAQRQAQLNTKG